MVNHYIRKSSHIKLADVIKQKGRWFVTDDEGAVLPSNPVDDSGKQIGHPTKQKAENQLTAIEIAKHRSRGKKADFSSAPAFMDYPDPALSAELNKLANVVKQEYQQAKLAYMTYTKPVVERKILDEFIQFRIPFTRQAYPVVFDTLLADDGFYDVLEDAFQVYLGHRTRIGQPYLTFIVDL